MRTAEMNETNARMTVDEAYQMIEGTRTAAFLLVIPGAAIFGAGAGMLIGNLLAGATMGLGVGCVLWGLVVALRKRGLPEK